MGYFSWMFADKNNKENLRIGKRAYVLCPDGAVIIEECYDGYGRFGNYDIYDLVVDWNRKFITTENVKKPNRDDYPAGELGQDSYIFGMRDYERNCKKITDIISGKSSQYMYDEYGPDWKRELGICIACYDEENASLNFPIKICKSYPRNVSYGELPPSKGDPNQGCC